MQGSAESVTKEASDAWMTVQGVRQRKERHESNGNMRKLYEAGLACKQLGKSCERGQTASCRLCLLRTDWRAGER